jgi:hypothetical protein
MLVRGTIMKIRVLLCVFALFLGSQLTWGQTAPAAIGPTAVKSLAEVTEFCNNPTGGGSFDATRKAAMDQWATDHGFKPISGPCKTKGQWILTWTEPVTSTHEAVLEKTPSGSLEVRAKKTPGTIVLSRVSAVPTLEPTGEVLYQASAANIEEGLDGFLQSVGQAKNQAEQAAAAENQATAEKPASATKPTSAAKRVQHSKRAKAEKQAGGN